MPGGRPGANRRIAGPPSYGHTVQDEEIWRRGGQGHNFGQAHGRPCENVTRQAGNAGHAGPGPNGEFYGGAPVAVVPPAMASTTANQFIFFNPEHSSIPSAAAVGRQGPCFLTYKRGDV